MGRVDLTTDDNGQAVQADASRDAAAEHFVVESLLRAAVEGSHDRDDDRTGGRNAENRRERYQSNLKRKIF